MVSMTQSTFWEGSVLAELTWTTMILITKRKGDCRGIVMVEMTWKMINTIINNRLRMEIYLHGALHGFR